jgi:type III pantothenate kinase
MVDNIDWIALMIGNSRLHWGWFHEGRLQACLDTPHLSVPLSIDYLEQILPFHLTKSSTCVLPLTIASVVPDQTRLCLGYPNLREITVTDIPLQDRYSTLGIDRALAVWGAGHKYGFPCFVIDAGTAITFTAVDGQKRLVGGAILPGLRVQLQSLVDHAAALPLVSIPHELPPIWGKNTTAAIESGIIHTIIAGMEKFLSEWSNQYPGSSLLLTGGDAPQLELYWKTRHDREMVPMIRDNQLIFEGMSALSRFGKV